MYYLFLYLYFYFVCLRNSENFDVLLDQVTEITFKIVICSSGTALSVSLAESTLLNKTALNCVQMTVFYPDTDGNLSCSNLNMFWHDLLR